MPFQSTPRRTLLPADYVMNAYGLFLFSVHWSPMIETQAPKADEPESAGYL